MIIRLKRVFLVLLIICIFSLFFINHKAILKIVYPLKHEEIILNEASKYYLDPYIIMAIIYVESKFKPEATSNKGARGLMQIMPATGTWIATMINDSSFCEDDLYNPEINIRYGAWYLAQLKKKFDDNMLVVLAAYNGGEGNVDRWLKENKWDGSWQGSDKIPFAETRSYIAKVTKVYSKYKYLY
ncbi:soluble lytic murein transglycosylase [Orenia metallireducens]|uniref:Soluble lytic murein transglycosylase n=1 Tax=Orenia metallireducens TaxID=1413210 RepID=A0A285GST3_9FIRM|nr:lytic transglycosylase domain-containing protein [Orenia metallireducens]PRX32648.1 soluble lytic murein transglycosylase [Orenia metallireducens]SNY26710.1 soluble lytic murein transglycosylase [Orenia metallireducens]